MVEHSVLSLTSGGSMCYCRLGEVGTHDLYFTAQGELALLLRQDDCFMRKAPPDNLQLFIHVH